MVGAHAFRGVVVPGLVSPQTAKFCRGTLRCAECQHVCSTRVRGLCQRCYGDPVVRERHKRQPLLRSPPIHCVECHRVCGTRMRRRLCGSCYNNAAIRARHVQTGSLTTLRGRSTNDRDWYRPTPPLPEPTHHLPGTAGKIAVLAARAQARQALWHPRDPDLRDHEESTAAVELLARFLKQAQDILPPTAGR